MALFNVTYQSKTINKYMAMNVILPEVSFERFDKEGKYPVLYLLHGYTDDYTRWLRQTSIERYAVEAGIAVVMADVGKSFYTDMASGDPYFTYLTEEVPAYVQKWFPITKDPEYTYICGLSMGGYGAIKVGMTYPERYKTVAAFSGAYGVAQMAVTEMAEDTEDWLKRLYAELPLIFGDVTKIAGSNTDEFYLTAQAKGSGKSLPELYLCCGTDDFVYQNTLAYKQFLDSLGISYTYHEEPETHNWGFWDRQLQVYIQWILDNHYEG